MDDAEGLTAEFTAAFALTGALAWLDQVLADPASALPHLAGGSILPDFIDSLTSFFGNAGGYFGSKARGLGDWLTDRFIDVSKWVSDQGSTVYAAVKSALDWVYDHLSSAVSWVTDQVGRLPGVVSSAASWVWDQVRPALDFGWGIVSNVASWLWDQIRPAIDIVGSIVSGTASWLLGLVAGMFSALQHVIGLSFDWLAGVVVSLVRVITDAASNAALWLWAQVTGAFNLTLTTLGNSVVWLANNTYNTVIQGAAALGDGFQSGLEWLINSAFGGTVQTIRDVMSVPVKMLRGGYTGIEGIIADLHLGDANGGFASFMYSLCAFIPSLVSIAAGLGPIYAADALQGANRIVGPTLLSLTETRDAWLRGLLNDGGLDDVLGRMGYNDIKKAILRELFFEPPPPSDVIRFAVREVYNPQLRAELQLDSEYPDAATQAGRNIGLAPQTMRDYWAAHWNLPSPEQVYVMLHRGLIDLPGVDSYLKVADFSPAWRNRLRDIAYRVPTRVDLRRMYVAGIITEDRVYRGYKDLGSTDADARILTDFAKRLAAGNPKKLPQGAILEGYRERVLPLDTALAELHALGLADDDARFMLKLEDFTVAQADEKLSERIVEHEYKARVITEGQARAQLAAVGVTPARASLLVGSWTKFAAAKTATLGVGQIQQLVREHFITNDVAGDRLAALGFNDRDAGYIVELAHSQHSNTEPPVLTLGQLFSSFRQGILNKDQLTGRLAARGYPPADVAILFELATPDQVQPEPAHLTLAQLLKAAKGGDLPVRELQVRLLARGYNGADVDLLLKSEKFTFEPTGNIEPPARRELTTAQLQKSFKDGLIDEKELRARLADQGYANDDIDLLVELVLFKPPPAGAGGAP